MRIAILALLLAAGFAHAVPSQQCHTGSYLQRKSTCGATGTESCCPADISALTPDADPATTTVDYAFTTDKGAGRVGSTAYTCAYTGSTPPTEAQVIAGSSPCVGTDPGGVTVSASGSQAGTVTGLSAGTTYRLATVHVWDGRPLNEVLTSATFITDQSGGTALTSSEYCVSAAGSDSNDGACTGGTGHWLTASHAFTQLSGVDGSSLYFRNTDTFTATGLDVQWSGTNGTTGRAVIGAFYDDGGTPTVLGRDNDWSDNPVFDCSGSWCLRITGETYVTVQDIKFDGGAVLTDSESSNPASVNSWLEVDTSTNIGIKGNWFIAATAASEYDCMEFDNSTGVLFTQNRIEVCGQSGTYPSYTPVPQKGDMLHAERDSSQIGVIDNYFGFAGHSAMAIQGDQVVSKNNTFVIALPNGEPDEDPRAATWNADNSGIVAYADYLSEANVYYTEGEIDGQSATWKMQTTGGIWRYEWLSGDNSNGPKADTCCFSAAQDLDARHQAMYNWTVSSGTMGEELLYFANFAPNDATDRDMYDNPSKNIAVAATFPGAIVEFDINPTYVLTDNWDGNSMEGWTLTGALTSYTIEHDEEGTFTISALESSQPSYFANNTGGLADPVTTDQGVDLTTVSSGCGTSSIVVDDARWFWGFQHDFDGDGVVDVDRDEIYINNVAAPTLTGVNKSTNTLTFSGSVTCTAGDPVNHAPMEAGSGDIRTGIPSTITPGSTI